MEPMKPATSKPMCLTTVATAETLLRLVQSVPSPKAEPIKLWLAKVGYERMREMADPSLGPDRARELWRKHGRSEKWIQQRMMGQETRNKPAYRTGRLTDYWKTHDIKEGDEFAILTNITRRTAEWSGVAVKDHKAIKGLKTQNLRDHMTEAEPIFTALAEMSTRQIAETEQAAGMPKNKVAALPKGRGWNWSNGREGRWCRGATSCHRGRTGPPRVATRTRRTSRERIAALQLEFLSTRKP